jgi:hypothetical protein|tara:strand:- start:115 stop:645 length:531 start_codon:yes stop_codon:yes gene_type:complete
MNTCLTDEMCIGKKNKYYNQWCIYYMDNYNYSPNYTISCHPEERINIYTNCESCWKWTDCCADSPEECCIREFYSYPPTSSPTLHPCSDGCDKKYQFDKCNVFEKINTKNTCESGDNIQCCSNDRTDCCIFRTTEVFGSMFLIIIILLLSIYMMIRDKYKINSEIISKKINPILNV